jgi:hypothetical protein
MKIATLAGVACALALTACAGQTPQMTESKTLAGLWTSLDAASMAADAAAKSGELKGAKAQAVADDLQKATRLITDADAAYHANPTADTSAMVLQATALIADALCIAKPAAGCP